MRRGTRPTTRRGHALRRAGRRAGRRPGGCARSTSPPRATLPGVTHVLTHAEMPKLGAAAGAARRPRCAIPLQDDEIRYQGEPIAIVLARDARSRRARRIAGAGRRRAERRSSRTRAGSRRRRRCRGRADTCPAHRRRARRRRARRSPARRCSHEATYVQPSRHHNPMEPSATLAQWRRRHADDGRRDPVGVRRADRDVRGVRHRARAGAGALAAHRRRVRLQGARLAPPDHRARRPRGSASARCGSLLTRAQMYSVVAYQPQMVQTVRWRPRRDGRLAAIEHESINVTSVSDDFVEYATRRRRRPTRRRRFV